MRLTRYTDYGLRTLIHLAAQKDGRLIRIRDIVDCFDLSTDHVRKIVHQLSQLGYIETTRGKGGGMRLGRACEEINIGQVVRDLEPTLKPVECDEPRCRLTPNCELKSVLGEAMRAFTGVLDGYTLADIVANRRSVAKLLGIK